MKTLCVALSLFSAQSYAAQWEVNAKVNTTSGYNDNVTLSKLSPKGSLWYTLTPVVNVSRKADNSLVKASMSYGYQRYLSFSQMTGAIQAYTLTGDYNWTDRLTFSMATSLNISPNYNTAALSSGNSSLNSTLTTLPSGNSSPSSTSTTVSSGNFSSGGTSTSISFSPSITYKLTQIDSLKLTTSYSDVSFTGTGAASNFSNSQSQSISFAWQRQWSERLSNSLSTDYSRYQSTAQQSANYSVNLGTNYLLSEKWSIAASVGGRFTTFGNSSVNGQNNAIGSVFNIVANYKGEQLSSQLGINRSLMPSSQGTLQQQSSANLGLNYALSEKLSTSLGASYSVSDNTGVSLTYISIQPALNWLISPDWTTVLGYKYISQNAGGGIQNTGNAYYSNGASNSFMLSINYNWQGLSLSR